MFDTPRRPEICSGNVSLKGTTQKTCLEAYNNYILKTSICDPNGNNRLDTLNKSKQHDHIAVATPKEG